MATLGNTDVCATETNIDARMIGLRCTLGTPGVFTVVHARLKVTNASNVYCAIYRVSDGRLMATGLQVFGAGFDNWGNLTLTAPVFLWPGQYDIHVWGTAAGLAKVRTRNDTAEDKIYCLDTNPPAAPAWPEPENVAHCTGYDTASIYADYTPGGAEGGVGFFEDALESSPFTDFDSPLERAFRRFEKGRY